MKTDSIVLAKAKSVRYTVGNEVATIDFETIEFLKGNVADVFEMKGFVDGHFHESVGDFDKHRAAEFWAYNDGNSVQLSTCGVLGVFGVGENYLVFLRDSAHYRGYENIRSEDDLWLAVIRLILEN